MSTSPQNRELVTRATGEAAGSGGFRNEGWCWTGVWGSSGDGLRSHRAEDGTWQLGVAARGVAQRHVWGVSFRKRA